MADPSDLQEKMSRILECPICIDQFTSPRVLPCQHTYCKTCLEDIWDKSKIAIKCPNCRRRHRVPKNGIDGFPPNVTISDLLEWKNVAKEQQKRQVDSELGAHLEHMENSARYLRGLSEACDEGVVIKQRGEAVKTEIATTFKRYHTILEERESHLKKKVDKIVREDLVSRDKWNTNVNTKLAEVEQVQESVKNDEDDGKCLGQQAANLSRDISIIATSMPKTTKYHFTFGRQMLRTHITHYGSLVLQPEDGSPMISMKQRRSIISEADNPEGGKPIVVDYYPSQKPLHISDISQEGNEFTPFGIAIAPSGNVIATDLENHRAIIFTERLEQVTSFGTFGDGDGELNRPTGIAVDSDGVIFLADQVNNRVQLFDSFGRYKSQFGKKGSEPGQMVFPCGLTIDKYDQVLVCDSGNYRVQIFERDGTVLHDFGSRELFINQPMHIAQTSLGNVLVTDQKYIHVFNKGKAIKKIYFLQPSSIIVDHFGNLVVGDNHGHLVVLRENGEELSRIGTCGKEPGQFIEPRGFAISKQGHLIAGDCNTHRLQSFNIHIIHDETDSKE